MRDPGSRGKGMSSLIKLLMARNKKRDYIGQHLRGWKHDWHVPDTSFGKVKLTTEESQSYYRTVKPSKLPPCSLHHFSTSSIHSSICPGQGEYSEPFFLYSQKNITVEHMKVWGCKRGVLSLFRARFKRKTADKASSSDNLNQVYKGALVLASPGKGSKHLNYSIFPTISNGLI